MAEKFNHKKSFSSGMCQRKQELSFELVDNNYSIWKLSKAIAGLSLATSTCPKCNVRLEDGYTLIPITAQQKAKIPGRLCPICNILYVSNSSTVSQIMCDNPFSKEFTLNGKALWNATQMEKKRHQKAKWQEYCSSMEQKLSEVSGAAMIICIKFQNQFREEFFITTHKDLHGRKNVYHYASIEGRELLSAAFAKERSREGSLHGCDFKVKSTFFTNRQEREYFERIRPVELEIQLSQRYEIIRATFDKEFEYYYSDISLYRHFVWKYGNPGTKLYFANGSNSKKDSFALRPESILKGYGYDVSEASGLSTIERQSILSEIIDLGILEVPKIISYLDFFCHSHPSGKDYCARLRWTADKTYVEHYKVNPDRFLIAQAKIP